MSFLASAPRGAHVLITGGAGFIGSHLVSALARENRVRVLDIFRRDALRPAGLHEHPNVEVVQGDVLDMDAVKKAVSDVDLVIHLASIAGVDTVMKMPTQTMRVSLLGTAFLLDAAHASGRCRRFVDFSTSEVFGRYAYQVSELDATTVGAVGEARWTYAVSKLATEHLAMTYYRQFHLPAVTVRPFNVYGPRQIGEGAVHHFIVRALKGQPLLIHNDGAQIRAWCYIDDIVEATLLTLTAEQAPGQAFNLGNPRSTVTVYHLAKLIKQLCGSSSPIEFVRWDHPDVELRVPSVDKAKELLQWAPRFDLEEGLLQTIEWYRNKLASAER
ncbi:MAG TPA: GDP-mannose 4,6-dehydratase [Pseudomonadota bacterium]|nr:GDP-mannose 4,6-dehydratase [Pseudomonadota bacterium]